MSSRSTLKVLCDHASEIAKSKGFDIDVASTLRIEARHIPGYEHLWWNLVSTPNGFGDEPYIVLWHKLLPLEKFFAGDAISALVMNDSQVPDSACDTILQSLASTGAELVLRKSCYMENKRRYLAFLETLKLNENDKLSYSKLIGRIRDYYAEFEQTSTTEIDFIPRGVTTFEEAHIWCTVCST